MTRRAPTRTALVLIFFAATFICLTVRSHLGDSATVDEPAHVTIGHTALRFGDFRVSIVHPPFLRMWSALPLLATRGVRLDTNTVFWLPPKEGWFSNKFLFLDNDANQLINRARFMNVLLGVLLGILLFCWGRELFGFRPATAVLAMYCFEPNIVAHFGLATTDAVACFIFATLYFLWRATRQLSLINLTGLVLFFVLAQASKFTAWTLWPICAALLGIHALGNNAWPSSLPALRGLVTRRQRICAAVGIFLLLTIGWYAGIWACYGFRYEPSPKGSGVDRIVAGPNIHKRMPKLAVVMDWIDDHRLFPNGYAQGFLMSQGSSLNRSGYLLGETRENGWWYYFPLAFLFKTPASLIILFFTGLALSVRGWSTPQPHAEVFVLLPLFLYLGAAMTAKLNIGVRHLLPLYPLVLLAAGSVVATAFATHRKLLVAAITALFLIQIAEVTAVYPHYLAFFNQFVGGPKNGYKYLADSNIDWGQDLKNLKKWMDDNGAERINLGYAGFPDPAYYGINCTYLLGSPAFVTNKVEQPVLPGLVAVSVHHLTSAGLDGNPFYKPLLDAKPVAVIGYSIYIYRVDKPWW